MQLSADDVRTAVGGQWIVPPAAGNPAADGIRAFAPFMLHGVGTDTREDLRGRLFVALRGERFDAHSFLADAAMRQAGEAVLDWDGGTRIGDSLKEFTRGQPMDPQRLHEIVDRLPKPDHAKPGL